MDLKLVYIENFMMFRHSGREFTMHSTGTFAAVKTFTYIIIIQLTPHWVFSVTDYIKYFAHVTYLAQTIYLYNN